MTDVKNCTNQRSICTCTFGFKSFCMVFCIELLRAWGTVQTCTLIGGLFVHPAIPGLGGVPWICGSNSGRKLHGAWGPGFKRSRRRKLKLPAKGGCFITQCSTIYRDLNIPGGDLYILVTVNRCLMSFGMSFGGLSAPPNRCSRMRSRITSCCTAT